MVDADSIFINAALYTLNPDLHIVSELVHNANMPFLNEVNQPTTLLAPSAASFLKILARPIE